jgi:Tfp pilus assembly protein PilV
MMHFLKAISKHSGFTTKRAERSTTVFGRTSEASAGRKSVRGFTLVETMVAITILIVSIVGPYVAVSNSLNATYAARDELIATSLAQEVAEYVLLIRDNNFLYNLKNASTPVAMTYGLDSTSGPNGIGTNCFAPNWCKVDPSQNTVAQCAVSGTTGCPVSSALYLANTGTTPTYFYTQVASGNTVTRFTRSLQLSNVVDSNGNTEVKVTVLVSWNNHGARSVTVTDLLSNWL